MSKEINCFGFETPFYRSTFNEIEPYKFEKSGNDVYVCFEETTGNYPIIKINKTGDVYTQTWGYGKWSERTALSNFIAINKTRVVED